jgi:hypothetical protein
MGYDKNRGLGVNAQGPTKLIEESKQKGRRGLGFSFQDFNDETAEWNFDNDPVIMHFYSSSSSILVLIFLGSGRRRNSLVSI